MNKLLIFSMIGITAIATIMFVTSNNKQQELASVPTSANSIDQLVFGTQATTEAEGEIEKDAGTSTVAQMMSKGGDWSCSVSHKDAGIETVGTVRISGTKMRGDFSTKVAVMPTAIQSHMISDGADIYAWSSMMKSGVKMPIAESADAKVMGMDVYNQSVQYSCAPWKPEAGLFNLPAEITFEAFAG